jgi:hypothetical protein
MEADAMTDRYIRCRFCDYRVRPIARTKGGRVVSGWVRLQKHVEDMHTNESLAEDDKINEYMRQRLGAGKAPD